MLINRRNALMAGGGGGEFDFYPYWGTDDIAYIFNAARNQGATADHSSSATSWIDITKGYVAAKKFNNPYWVGNAYYCNTTKRMLQLDGQFFSGVNAFTFNAYGYWAKNWGMMVKVATGSQSAIELMPWAENVGVSLQAWSYRSVRTTIYNAEAVLTVTFDGSNVKGYVNGEQVSVTEDGSDMSAMLTRLRNSQVVRIGGNDNNGYYTPNGSKLYDFAAYKRCLTDAEVKSLYNGLKTYYQT